MIIVDSRKRDPKSEMVVKHENPNGNPINYKPIRRINPDMSRLSPLARFIVENEDGSYIGGFLHRKNDVRVEGLIGSRHALNVRVHGQKYADDIKEMYNITPQDRAFNPGWLFDVFEPSNDETEYFNRAAEKIQKTAGSGGRIIIHGNIFEVTA
mgnify:CR=1 FL=1